MSENSLSPEFLERLKLVTGKRSRVVIDHILKFGYVTTEDLEQIYGYKHPPRAVKDVRDQGIPIEKYNFKSNDGRTIAAYRFGNISDIRKGRIGGRTAFPRKFKETLYAQSDGKCAVCNGRFLLRELQIDHRVPYEIAGDAEFDENNSSAYMLLCGSCNRAKSWTCEHCVNWQEKNVNVCQGCYWVDPTVYVHIATQNIRRAEIVWQTDEAELYDKIADSASKSQDTIQDYIKTLLKNILASVLRLFM
jgi:hypothetical protein